MQQKLMLVDEYISQFTPEVQKMANKCREVILEHLPNAKEAISYGMPTYKLEGCTVHFACYKKHIGFYPGPDALLKFKTEIENFKHSKGAVQFPLDWDVPVDLIAKIVRYARSLAAMDNRFKIDKH